MGAMANVAPVLGSRTIVGLCWGLTALVVFAASPDIARAETGPTAVKVGPVLTVADGTASSIATGGAVAYNRVNDEFFVVWRNSGPSAELHGRGVSVHGGFVDEAQILVSDEDPISSPSIAHDPLQNQHLVVWKGMNNHAYGRVVTDTGEPVTDPWDASVAGWEMTVVFNPAAATGGEFFISGRSSGSGSPPGIYGERINNAGGGAGSIEVELSGSPGPAGQVALNESDSQVLVTWRDQENFILKGRIINSDGSFVTDSFVISTVFPTAVIATGVAFDPVHERYFVVFGEFQGGPLRGQFIAADGTLDGDPITLIDSVEEEFPCLAYDPVNQVYLLVWFSYWRVHCQLVSLDGELLGTAVEITSSWTSFRPSVAASTDQGGFLVVWNRTANWSVHGQLIRVGGGDLVFANGFEGGNTHLWNVTVP